MHAQIGALTEEARIAKQAAEAAGERAMEGIM
jgi:hypothetical protein